MRRSLADNLPEPATTVVALVRALPVIVAATGKAFTRLEDLLELLERLQFWAAESQQALSAEAGDRSALEGRARMPAAVRQMLEHLAAAGVAQVDLEPTAAGGNARIDAGRIDGLPRREFHLLQLLAAAPVAEDGFRAYVHYATLAHRFQEHFGRPFSKHSIDNIVWRLRAALLRARVNPSVVETSDAGVRLRWKPTSGGNKTPNGSS